MNELSNLCGLTPSTVYSLMDPTRKDVRITTIKKICDGLEITLGEFFTSAEFDNLEHLEQEIK
ncbi:helix-turn-helix domain-containing protein [Hydrogenoanaerobacterium saccharovorans]|uniref:helix-turn-helix domain-containing protein n=1 Tax=Hydrogenoanaerobacterium saccharovorans TaxID=474960 RepID=UPI000B80977D|nr:helix-turn-helix transcriptional regulator [Hydrogenoanaerobacterium saccharovorans]